MSDLALYSPVSIQGHRPSQRPRLRVDPVPAGYGNSMAFALRQDRYERVFRRRPLPEGPRCLYLWPITGSFFFNFAVNRGDIPF